LSYWSESPPSEAEYISLTLGSLEWSDLRDLDELGLLPEGALGEWESGGKAPTMATVIGGEGQHAESHEVVPWFETMLQGSSLSRVRRSRGKRQTQDGRVRMEWEIVELLPNEGPENDTQASGKRKLEDDESHDSAMG
jgi:hypothetical protein